jgi:hypothetical protein
VPIAAAGLALASQSTNTITSLLYPVSMDCDGIRPNANIPDKMGVSRTFVLHGLRAGSMPRVCTVRARRQGSRLVLGRPLNVSVGAKPSWASNAVEMRVGALILPKGGNTPHRPKAVQAHGMSHAESD